MRGPNSIFSTSEFLFLSFGQAEPDRWYHDITCLIDTDDAGRIQGLEVLLYEETEIDFARVREQLSGAEGVIVGDAGMLYVSLRSYLGQKGRGFGRGGSIGITQHGNLAVVRFRWNELGASVPKVDPAVALAGLDSSEGPPVFTERA